MTISPGRVLDRLVDEKPCLGAVFTAYGFDPAFFEDHVLRAVLRLGSDPVEQTARYHGEARRALQETPVVAIVDSGERQPGRRLPYDVLDVSDVVFHPKSALLLYPERARLLVGSGNMTFAGYGGNTELFFCFDLAYDEPREASLLRAFDAHLARIVQLTRRAGTQLALFREELGRRLGSETRADVAPVFALLDTTEAPIFEQLAAMLPEQAVVESVGMLAPFYERDDGGDLDASSVFGALGARIAKDAVLDVGVSWDNAQVYPPPDAAALEDGLDRLWAWSYEQEDTGTRVIEYLVPTSVADKTMGFTDDAGRGRRWPIEAAVAAAEERAFWRLPTPEAYVPRRALEKSRKRFGEVRLWLHPATRLLEGQPVHRPLHAKLLLIGYRAGRTRGTLVLVGSPNMSRRALLLRAGPGQGNVELALAFCLEGSVSLKDFVPELVHAPTSALELREREFPETGRNYALAVDEVVHDPVERTLVVTWSEEAKELPAWRLSYDGEELSSSSEPPSAPVVVRDFVLRPASAEVVLHVQEKEYAVPILVTDLVALPAEAMGTGLGLDELLMLLGRRIGTERALDLAAKRGAAASEDELDAFFGEGFGPTDVFRAWWAAAEELREPGLSVQAFRLRLEGALGVGAAWTLMLDASRRESPVLSAAEVWFYGAELLRTLVEAELPPDADREAKARLLGSFMERVRGDLSRVPLDDDSRSWLARVRAFYQEASA